jgi:hypothetical protein
MEFEKKRDVIEKLREKGLWGRRIEVIRSIPKDKGSGLIRIIVTDGCKIIVQQGDNFALISRIVLNRDFPIAIRTDI